jgi:RND family efflux transporter MFP subunit
MKSSRSWIVGLVLLVILAAVGWRVYVARKSAVSASAPSTKVEAIELAATDVAVASVQPLNQGLALAGSLKAAQSVVVKARVPGELQGLQLREGDTVKTGQVLARIEPTEVLARQQQALRQVDAAQAQLDIALRQHTNNQAMVRQGFISNTALETSESNLAAAKANKLAMDAAVDLTRKAMADSVLRAPIDGQVSQRIAQNGERVPVDGQILVLVDLRQLEMEAAVSAAESVGIRVGQTADLQIEGSGALVPARVVRINPSTMAGSRSVLVYLALTPSPGLRQGLFAQGFLNTEQNKALAVPQSAVRNDKPAPYVQVVRDGHVVHVPVELGARGIGPAPERTPLVAVTGLAEQAQIVLASAGGLPDGAAVRFTTAPASVKP